MPIYEYHVKNAACVLSFYRRLVKKPLEVCEKMFGKKWAGLFHRVHSISRAADGMLQTMPVHRVQELLYRLLLA